MNDLPPMRKASMVSLMQSENGIMRQKGVIPHAGREDREWGSNWNEQKRRGVENPAHLPDCAVSGCNRVIANYSKVAWVSALLVTLLKDLGERSMGRRQRRLEEYGKVSEARSVLYLYRCSRDTSFQGCPP